VARVLEVPAVCVVAPLGRDRTAGHFDGEVSVPAGVK
jgi:hypothetical protein